MIPCLPLLITSRVVGVVEDLGGPTPQNSKPDDDSNKLKTPTATIKQVKDVVNKGLGKADSMPAAKKGAMSYEETESKEEEVISEEPATEETKVDINAAIEEDVNALLSGEDLSEEFKEKELRPSLRLRSTQKSKILKHLYKRHTLPNLLKKSKKSKSASQKEWMPT